MLYTLVNLLSSAKYFDWAVFDYNIYSFISVADCCKHSHLLFLCLAYDRSSSMGDWLGLLPRKK